MTVSPVSVQVKWRLSGIFIWWMGLVTSWLNFWVRMHVLLLHGCEWAVRCEWKQQRWLIVLSRLCYRSPKANPKHHQRYKWLPPRIPSIPPLPSHKCPSTSVCSYQSPAAVIPSLYPQLWPRQAFLGHTSAAKSCTVSTLTSLQAQIMHVLKLDCNEWTSG